MSLEVINAYKVHHHKPLQVLCVQCGKRIDYDKCTEYSDGYICDDCMDEETPDSYDYDEEKGGKLC